MPCAHGWIEEHLKPNWDDQVSLLDFHRLSTQVWKWNCLSAPRRVPQLVDGLYYWRALNMKVSVQNNHGLIFLAQSKLIAFIWLLVLAELNLLIQVESSPSDDGFCYLRPGVVQSLVPHLWYRHLQLRRATLRGMAIGWQYWQSFGQMCLFEVLCQAMLKLGAASAAHAASRLRIFSQQQHLCLQLAPKCLRFVQHRFFPQLQGFLLQM